MLDRSLPLAAGIYFLVIGLIVRVIVHRARHGSPGIRLFSSLDTVAMLREAMHGLVHMTVMMQALLAAAAPDLHAKLGSLVPGSWTWLKPAGAAVVFVSGLALAASQRALGASWLMGLEESAKPGLVTTGIYSWCRNPIFLFLQIAILGFLMLMPNWVSLACFALSLVAIRWQVAAEEKALARLYGEQYLAYASRVGRFTPWTGRLRRTKPA